MYIYIYSMLKAEIFLLKDQYNKNVQSIIVISIQTLIFLP